MSATRVRPDGNDQYLEVKGDFGRYVEDPYVEPGFSREPLRDEVDALIIGGGFGGLMAGARLRGAGVKRIRIIERAATLAAPGTGTAIPARSATSKLYLSAAARGDGLSPREKYSFAPEIREHARRIAETFDLYGLACFQTEICELRWLEDENKWLKYRPIAATG